MKSKCLTNQCSCWKVGRKCTDLTDLRTQRMIMKGVVDDCDDEDALEKMMLIIFSDE